MPLRRFAAFAVVVAFVSLVVAYPNAANTGQNGVLRGQPAAVTDGLVAHYPFSGNADDASGNANHGVVHGATLTTDRFGNADSAYSFDGSNDYILSSTTFAQQNRGTISFWVKAPSGGSIGGALISSRSTSGYESGDFFITADAEGKIGVGYWATSGWETMGGAMVASDEWTHIAISWDSEDVARFYVGGSSFLEDATEVSYPLFDGLPLMFGNDQVFHFGSWVTNFGRGELDDVRIYDRALSAEEVAQLYSGLSAGLVAHYPFSGNANDASGSGNHGAVHGATLTTDRFGNPNSAYLFDGVDDYIDLGLGIDADFSALTVSAWVSGVSGPIFTRGVHSLNDVGHIELDFNGWFQAITTGQNFDFVYDQLSLSQWALVTAVWDGTTARVYVNGVDTGITEQSTGEIPFNGLESKIGLRPKPSRHGYFDGAIDDVRIYNRALSAQEVAELYFLNPVEDWTVEGTPADLILGHSPEPTTWSVVPVEGEEAIYSGDDPNGALVSDFVASGDFVFTGQFSALANGDSDILGLVFDWQSHEQTHFVAWGGHEVARWNGHYHISRRAGDSYSDLVKVQSNWTPTWWYDFSVEKTGSTYRIRILSDGSVAHDHTFTDETFSSGRVGIHSTSQSVYFRRLSFTGETSVASDSCTAATDASELFESRTTHGVDYYPMDVALGDINNDGNEDAVVTSDINNFFRVLLGQGNGSFSTQSTYGTEQRPESIALGDLNNDGNLDAVTTGDDGPDSVSVLLGHGNGAFASRSTYGVGPDPKNVTLADLDNDAVLDVVTSNGGDNTLSILLGQGDGSFASAISYAGGGNIALGDLDGDEVLDLVSNLACDGSSSAVQWSENGHWYDFLGYGLGGIEDPIGTWENAQATAEAAGGYLATPTSAGEWAFMQSQMYDWVGPVDPVYSNCAACGYRSYQGWIGAFQNTNSPSYSEPLGGWEWVTGEPWGFTAWSGGEPNHSGGEDHVLTWFHDSSGWNDHVNGAGRYYIEYDSFPGCEPGTQTIAVRLGAGDGSFGEATTYVGNGAVALGDIDANGTLDVVVSNESAGTVSVRLGAGDGTLGEAEAHSAQGGRIAPLADLNGDGVLDVLVGNWPNGSVTALLGECDGGLGEQASYDVGTQPRSLALGDLNNDGFPDFAAPNYGAHTLSVLLGVPPPCDDTDGDGWCDELDNCSNDANADQVDLDGDGLGDVCDPDIDGDGVAQECDSASLVPGEPSVQIQADGPAGTCYAGPVKDVSWFFYGGCGTYKDFPVDPGTPTLLHLRGDICIPNQSIGHNPSFCIQEDTGSGYADETCFVEGESCCDACTRQPEPYTPATDHIRVAVTGDFYLSVWTCAVDNCPEAANADQANHDDDPEGDACDADDDGDGVPDGDDAFPLDPAEDTDTDGDGVGDNADPDDDNDGFTDAQEAEAGTDSLDAESKPGVDYGLVAHYPFSGNADDASGNANHGIVDGATLTADRFGNASSAYNFDGTASIEIADASGLRSVNTVNAWVKLDLLGLGQYVIDLGEPNNNWIEITPTGIFRTGNDHDPVLDTVQVAVGEWVMLTRSYDGVVMRAYANGTLVGSLANSESIVPTKISIGSAGTPGPSYFLNGAIDDVRIYNRALSAQEVAELYFLNPVEDWTVEGTPADLIFGHSPEPTTWSVVPVEGEEAIYSGDDPNGSLVSDFIASGDFVFTGQFSALANGDSDILGLVFDWQSHEQTHFVAWGGREIARWNGHYHISRRDGDDYSDFVKVQSNWTPTRWYDFSVEKTGSTYRIRILSDGSVAHDHTFTDETFSSGRVGIHSTSQSVYFRRLSFSGETVVHSENVCNQGEIVSWGRDNGGQVSDTPTGDTFIAIAGGGSHSLALTADGSMISWGYDDRGQVSDTPTGSGFIAIAAGTTVYDSGGHSLALAADGSIVSWGNDDYGQVSNTPSGTGFTAIAAGRERGMALAADGSIVSWGNDLESVVSDTPTGSGFTAIGAGEHHSLALAADGSIVSWGRNAYGEVSGTPAGSGFVAIAAGGYHSMALAADGSIVAWARNSNGQVSNTPTEAGFIAIAAGVYHGLALAADGSILSWGNDVNGQVGETPGGTGFTAIAAGVFHSLALHRAGSVADVCDAGDADGDGVPDTSDNCPAASNADQANFDGDSEGDVCDLDDDNDGVPDTEDAFPFDASESADTDGDGIGNNADLDDDNDGFTDVQEAEAGTDPLDDESKPGIAYGLVAHYPFSGNADDASGNGNDGTVVGPVLVNDRHGNPNGAYRFDGIDDRIELQPVFDTQASSFTFAAWINETYSIDSILYGEYAPGGSARNQFALHHAQGFNGSLITHQYPNATGGNDPIVINANLNDLTEQWIHVVLTKGPGGVTAYLNGVEMGVVDRELSYTGGNPTVAGIGGRFNTYDNGWSNPSTYLGDLDEFRIYNRALSAQEVAELYFLNPVEDWTVEGTPADLIFGHSPEPTTWSVVPVEGEEAIYSGDDPNGSLVSDFIASGDFVFTGQFSALANGDSDILGLVFDWQSHEQTHFVAWGGREIARWNGHYHISRRDGDDYSDFVKVQSNWTPTRWYDFSVEKTGSTYRIRILSDGSVAHDHTFTDETFSSGRVGIHSTSQSVYFRRLSFTGETSVASDSCTAATDASGLFESRTTHGVDYYPMDVALGDINNDGNEDAVVTSDINNFFRVLLGQGNGSFSTQSTYGTEQRPESIALGDLNNDGNLDAVTTGDDGPDSVSVLLGQGNGSFASRSTYGVGPDPKTVTLADLDDDGALDVLTSNGGDSTVSVLLGQGNGSFASAVSYAGGGSIAAGDLDGDGVLDLVSNYACDTPATAKQWSGNSHWYDLIGNGLGGSDQLYTWPEAKADAEARGGYLATTTSAEEWAFLKSQMSTWQPETVWPNGGGTYQGWIGAFQNTSSPSYSEPGGGWEWVTGEPFSYTAWRSGEPNNSGGEDYVLTWFHAAEGWGDFVNYGESRYYIEYDSFPGCEPGTQTIAVRLGAGDGSFGEATTYVGNGAVALGDIDGDGALDVVVSNESAATVSVRLGAGDGTLGEATTSSSNGGRIAPLADFNGDGVLDVAVSYYATNGSLTALLGQCDGSLGSQGNYDIGSQPRSLALGDLNGDGAPDLAAPNYGSRTISVLLGVPASCTDTDGDGWCDELDNCSNDANADQANHDDDPEGDACDVDDDNDGVPDGDDAFPLDPAEDTDTDADGVGNNADPDDDNDGFTDAQEAEAGTDPLDAESKPGIDYGLAAHYPFSGNANDASGSGNHGVVEGATLTADRFGNANAAYSFDGNGLITLPSFENQLSEGFSFSAWVYQTSVLQHAPVITKPNPNPAGGWPVSLILGTFGNEQINANNRLSLYVSSDGSIVDRAYRYSNEVPDAGVWVHVVGLYDPGTRQEVFINGVLSNGPLEGDIQSSYLENSQPFQVGRILPNGYGFEGMIDDVRIYDRALSAEEVAELYAIEPEVGSCQGWLEAGETESGLYTIHPDGGSAIDVYCDMTTQGGGWTKVLYYPALMAERPCASGSENGTLTANRYQAGEDRYCQAVDTVEAIWGDGREMLAVGDNHEVVVTFDDTSSTSRGHFLTSLHSDPGPGALDAPTGDGTEAERCATAQMITGGSETTRFHCYGSDWPGNGNLGGWADYILVGFGGHENNRGSNLSGLDPGAGGSFTDAAYYVRSSPEYPVWITVDSPGNALDDTGFGSVANSFEISKYETTVGQYAEFLNSVAQSDPHGLYYEGMGTWHGLIRLGSDGAYTYSVEEGRSDRPIGMIRFSDALRYANWMHNGKGNGDTETGAYTISGANYSDGSIQRNPSALIFLPSEDEWYKAAYFDPGTQSYFEYPTSSNGATTCSHPTSAPNSANCGGVIEGGNGMTSVGAYPGSPSPYGTYDQGGNVWEWNESWLVGDPGGLRGSSSGSNASSGSFEMAASYRAGGSSPPSPGGRDVAYGFRVARAIGPRSAAVLALDGVDDRACRSDLPSELLGGAAKFVGAWVRPQPSSGWQIAFSMGWDTSGGAPPGGQTFELGVSESGAVALGVAQWGYESPHVVPFGEWSYVFMIWDPARDEYAVGVIDEGAVSKTDVAPENSASQKLSAGPICLGAYANKYGTYDKFFNGNLSKVSLLDHVPTDGEILELALGPDTPDSFPGLTAFWSLNQTSGSTATDDTGNGWDLELVNGAAWQGAGDPGECSDDSGNDQDLSAVKQWPVAEGGNGHWYEFRSVDQYGPHHWEAAKAEAEAAGGYLATITSSEENSFFVNEIVIPFSRRGCFCVEYMGGFRNEADGAWQWVTGEPWSYTNWYPGEPNGGGNEPFLTAWWNDGKWNDIFSTEGGFAGYYIEWDSKPGATCNVGDADADGVPDTSDNCPGDANADQANHDDDPEGDACDADDDGDGFTDAQEAHAGTDPLDGESKPGIDYGLVAHYPFSGDADDASGNDNHGVVHGATLTTDRFGNADSAYSFDGVDDYIFVTPNLGGLTEFTKTLWLAPRASIYGSLFRTPNGGIGYDSGSSMLSVDVIEDRQGGMLSQPYSYDLYYAVPFSFVTDKWTHVAFVGNADNSASFFIDGVEISWSSSRHDDGVTGKLNGTIIGATYKSNETPQFESFADAVIDDLYLYSRALSPAEIATLATIPEPSAAVLAAAALAALAGLRARRRAGEPRREP